jgi:hypothetical protein
LSLPKFWKSHGDKEKVERAFEIHISDEGASESATCEGEGEELTGAGDKSSKVIASSVLWFGEGADWNCSDMLRLRGVEQGTCCAPNAAIDPRPARRRRVQILPEVAL